MRSRLTELPIRILDWCGCVWVGDEWDGYDTEPCFAHAILDLYDEDPG